MDDVIRNPEDCSSYIVCAFKPSIQHCEAGLHYDAKRKVCNWPQYADCKLEPQSNGNEEVVIEPFWPEVLEEDNKYYSPFMAIDVMSGETIDPMSDYDPQQMVCRHFGAYFLPHPKFCRSYFLCAYGHMHKHSCGLGSMWNYKIQKCEISVRAECYQQSSDEGKEIASSIPTTTDNPLMVCYTLAPTTTDGLPTNTWHPTGSIYNATATGSTLTTAMTTATSTTATSTSSTYAPTSKTSTTTSSVATPTKTPNSLNPLILECPSKNQSYIAHPRDCSKYYMCINGMPVLTSCPVGLFWDSKMEYCDFPKNVKCFQ